MSIIQRSLEAAGIHFCSIGYCDTLFSIELVPKILSLCNIVSCSVSFRKSNASDVCPAYDKCLAAAKSCLQLAKECGDLANFRFCSSFNCYDAIPFFPVAFHASNMDDSSESLRESGAISIGLENGDLLFLAFHGAGDETPGFSPNATVHSRGKEQLTDIMRQICYPIQCAAECICAERGLSYKGNHNIYMLYISGKFAIHSFYLFLFF